MRHRDAIAAIALAAAALLVAGCGSDSGGSSGYGRNSGDVSQPTQATTTPTSPSGPSGVRARSCRPEGEIASLRTVGENCGTALAVAADWSGRAGCSAPGDASRFACSVRGYRCLGTTAGRGIAVSCARPGRSISFIAEPR
jgi:hypothetical protein